MKKTFYSGLLTAGLALLGAGSSHAQVTSLTATGDVYTQNYCSLPSQAYIFINGAAQGTTSLNDSFTVHLNFDDGSDTTFKMDAYNTFDSVYAYLPHTYTLPGTYTPFGTITAPAPSTIVAPINFSPITLTNTCGNISGDLFVDANNNCSMDAGEQAVTYAYVTATASGSGLQYYGYSDMNGHYSIEVPYGDTYSVTANSWWTGMVTTCPAAGTANTVVVGTTGTYTANFGFNCASTTDLDLTAYGFGWNFRPGYERPLYIGSWNNNFCITPGATVTLTLGSQLSYAGNYLYNPPTTVSGNTLTWNVSAVTPWSGFWSDLMIYCDPSAQLNDTACVTITVTPAPGTNDTNLANNTYNLCLPINNSMDPNAKSVSPIGATDQGLIPVATKELTYLVEFQNTGTDVAYNVSINDQIDPALDPTSVHVMKSSAPVQATIVGGNTMKFRFNDINLADSTTNEPASHGYLLYTAKLKPGAVAGTVIHNTADIYFDYNSPISTNTTINTLQSPAGIQQLTAGAVKATVFPNPADATLNITLNDKTTANVTLMDMTGRTIQQLQAANGTATLSTKALAEGLYQVSIRSGAQVLSTKVLVKH